MVIIMNELTQNISSEYKSKVNDYVNNIKKLDDYKNLDDKACSEFDTLVVKIYKNLNKEIKSNNKLIDKFSHEFNSKIKKLNLSISKANTYKVDKSLFGIKLPGEGKRQQKLEKLVDIAQESKNRISALELEHSKKIEDVKAGLKSSLSDLLSSFDTEFRNIIHSSNNRIEIRKNRLQLLINSSIVLFVEKDTESRFPKDKVEIWVQPDGKLQSYISNNESKLLKMDSDNWNLFLKEEFINYYQNQIELIGYREYEDGYDDGYSVGYNNGFDKGKNNGYEEGYKKGYNDGEEGY